MKFEELIVFFGTIAALFIGAVAGSHVFKPKPTADGFNIPVVRFEHIQLPSGACYRINWTDSTYKPVGRVHCQDSTVNYY